MNPELNPELNRQLRNIEKRKATTVLDAIEVWRQLITAAHFDSKFERLADLDLAELRARVDELARYVQGARELRVEHERLKAEV